MRRPSRPARRALTLVAIGVSTLALAACGSTSAGNTDAAGAPTSTTATASAPTATTPAQPGATSPGAAVPDPLAFSANLVGGEALDLGSYAGKPVAFWFWAPT